MPGYLPRLAHSVLLSTLAAAAPASADWRHLMSAAPTEAMPTRFSVAADGALWTFDENSVRRTDTNGTTATLARPLLELTNILFDRGLALADGSLLLQDGSCALAHVDTALRVRWSVNATACNALDADASGISWAANATLLRQFGPDGVVRQTADIGDNQTVVALETLPDGGVHAIARRTSPPISQVLRYDARGRLQLNYVLGTAESPQHLLATADGGVLVFGITGSSVSLTRLEPNGTRRWTVQHGLRGDTALGAMLRDDGDALHLVSGVATPEGLQPRTLSRIGADGALQWQQDYCPATAADPLLSRDLVTDPAGGVAHLCAIQGQDRLLRRSAAGTTTQTTLPLDAALQVTRQGNTLYVLGRERPILPLTTRIVAVDAAGQIAPTRFDAPSFDRPVQLIAQTSDEAGATYLLAESDQGVARLRKVDARGAEVWTSPAPGLPLAEATLYTAGGQVCSAEREIYRGPGNGTGTLRARCWNAQTGTGGWQRETLPGFAFLLRIQPLRDGRTVYVTTSMNGLSIELISPDGSSTRVLDSPFMEQYAAIDTEGRVSVMTGASLKQYDLAGVQRYRVVAPIGGNGAIVPAADGSVVVAGQSFDSSNYSLWSVAPDGSTRWLMPLPSAAGLRVKRDATAIYLLESFGSDGLFDTGDAAAAKTSPPVPPPTTSLTAYRASDGNRLWQHASVNSGAAISGNAGPVPQLLLDDASGTLVLGHAQAYRVRLERLSRIDGLVLGETRVDCNGRCSPLQGLWPQGEEGVRAVLGLVDRQAGAVAAVIAVDTVVPAAPRVRVDQPGIAGLWHASYSHGQGLSLDWLPDSRTVFAAWFTYGVPGDGPGALRWYTLQANNVSPNTTRLELPILETSGGQFATGPAVAPREVGRAVLQLGDCDNATLDYRFTASNNAARGSITLTRVTPQTRSCQLADGTLQPGAGARPPAKGFDARFSGAWYDPAAVGQGLQLNIQPDGVFFAPWFTYDPADGRDDPNHHHWFTLQGDLTTAVAGRVELLLIQTIGGSFDARPTYNINVVGAATLQLLDCGRATLDYRFDGAAIAGPYAGRRGTLDLHRLGGCAP